MALQGIDLGRLLGQSNPVSESGGVTYKRRFNETEDNPYERTRHAFGKDLPEDRGRGFATPHEYQDPNRSSFDSYLAGLSADLEAEIARIKAGSSIPSTARYDQAVADALAMLTDVQANRSEAGKLYEGYNQIVTPYAEEALASAEQVGAIAQPMFDEQFAARVAGIHGAYDSAEAALVDVADLIGAGEHATAAALAEVTGRDLELQMAAAESSEIMALIELEEILLEKQAIADRARDEGQLDRRERLFDLEMQQREEAASDQLQRAREAAAEAAAARRRAIAARNAAIAEARAQATADQNDAGWYSALKVIDAEAGHLRDDKQLWLEGSVRAALEAGVPATGQGVALFLGDQRYTKEDRDIIVHAIDAFEDGIQAAYEFETGGISPSEDVRQAVRATGQPS